MVRRNVGTMVRYNVGTYQRWSVIALERTFVLTLVCYNFASVLSPKVAQDAQFQMANQGKLPHVMLMIRKRAVSLHWI